MRSIIENTSLSQPTSCNCWSDHDQIQQPHLERYRRRKRRAPRIPRFSTISALVLLSAFMMWCVQAFSTVPRVNRNVKIARVVLEEEPLKGIRRSRRSGACRLGAVNSRELRFYFGSKTLPKTENDQANGLTSIPEVLASSMSNYFFASHTTKWLDPIPEPQEEIKARCGRVADNTQVSFASSTMTTTLSSSSASSAVLTPVTHSLLLSQHYFRAASSGRKDPPEIKDKFEFNDLSSLNNMNSNRASGQQPVDETASALEDVGESKINGAYPEDKNADDLQYPPPRQGYGYSIQLTEEEKSLFRLLRQVHKETHLTTTLRVAGGWVRDKLLATPKFQIFHHYKYKGKRLTSKFKPSSSSPKSGEGQPSMGRMGTKVLGDDERQGPVDIDVALDTMLGREFADHLNAYLQDHGKDTVSVGVVLKNPEKSKHLETATMKVGSFWIDFVNLRAEEYADDSRIPDLMRIGTAKEDSFRRDLTINSLFFNINTGQVEDWTGRGFTDLRRGVVATPLAPLTTLLDDPLRVLRSIRFAARLRFTMDDELVAAARDDRVRMALAQKVSRERVGGEVDLMLRSPDPVGAMRLLVNLNLIDTVFPVPAILPRASGAPAAAQGSARPLFDKCLNLLSTTHDHLYDCKVTPPVWCQAQRLLTTNDVGSDKTLTKDEEARRLLWYAAFLKPIHDYAHRLKQQMQQEEGVSRRADKKANRSVMSKLLVDELKRPGRDANTVEKIMKAANDITVLIQSGCDVSATLILLSEVRVLDNHGILMPAMHGRAIDAVTEEDPVWEHAMEFRLLCARVLKRVGGLWRAALMLSLSEQLASLNDGELDYAIEGDVIDESKEERRQGIIEQYDTFAAALQQIGLIGIWGSTPLVDGQEMKELLPHIPRGPAFRDVMDEQESWMITHPGAQKDPLVYHLRTVFSDYFIRPKGSEKPKNPNKKPKKKKAAEKGKADDGENA